MTSVTVSSDYRITIPRSVRTALRMRPGQKLQAFEVNGRIELIPVRGARELRGFLRGIDTHSGREDGDRV